ncbi:M23 family metallopeptidase [Psychroserpens sp. Hel_I_66]|uniref:M23 family metallopeptidase n=1 Tax=Psychroserpens sp. Hel_I_66 TaxID=1250004 RepID=UPI000647A821|nr:M23 family metallopeptidase [Psychroserpens sp. Hel_I_66]
MKFFFIYNFLLIALFSCKQKGKVVNEDSNLYEEKRELVEAVKISEEKTDYIKLFNDHPGFVSNGFDFPVGKPNARGYYNAQKFKENNHLGDDWNGVGGGNSDLGDPIYAPANGYISEVKDYGGGWGNVIKIVHLHDDKLYESLYAHCDTTLVTQNKFIKEGEQIATIGNCNGLYFAHLHIEIRDTVGLGIGPGYSRDTTGYLNPTDFINKNRN